MLSEAPDVLPLDNVATVPHCCGSATLQCPCLSLAAQQAANRTLHSAAAQLMLKRTMGACAGPHKVVKELLS